MSNQSFNTPDQRRKILRIGFSAGCHGAVTQYDASGNPVIPKPLVTEAAAPIITEDGKQITLD